MVTVAKVLPAVVFLCICLSGCRLTQELKEDELLVNKVKIKGIEDNTLEDGAKLLQKQKPNKRLFGFWRFYLRAYNYGMRGDTSRRFRKYIRENIGEPPVIMDTAKLGETSRQIKAYLFNNGYFDADVKFTIDTAGRRHKMASITYFVEQKLPYTIDTIEYNIDDRTLNYVVVGDLQNSLLKEGQIFSKEKVAEERERITKKLRNEGYYFFNKEYVQYTVINTGKGHHVNVNAQIRNPDVFVSHKRYKISRIYVNVVNPSTDELEDSTVVGFKETSENLWLNLNGYHLNKDVLMREIVIQPGDVFSQNNVDITYNKLNNIQLLRQTSINFEKDTVENRLVCYINLFPGKRHEYILEPQIISSDQNNAVEQNNLRNYGLANVITYRNRNLLRSAEMLELRYRVSLEGQFRNSDSIPFFSNIEHNVTTTLALPRARLFPFFKRWFSSTGDRSSFVGNYIYESNIDFKRNVLSLGYNQTYYNIFNNFNLSFAEVSYNRTDAKRNFLALVNPADSIFIANLFTTNLILNSRFTWTYSDRPISRTGTYFSSKLIVESAGWTLRQFMRATNQPLPADGIYKIDNVNFEQFVKIDADVRYTHSLNELNALAYRGHIGVGLPYGNSTIMPFVRRYFIGGANSLRGWRPRTLGPGSFDNSLGGVRADRSGEVIIEAQAEYRFTLIRNLLQGALFADAGNIWYTHPLAGRQGVEINPNTFLGQMAVSGGLGIRFDFSFFVLRFDFGVPLRSPDLPADDRWLLNDYANGSKKILRSTILNLGLGYPF